MHGALLSLLEGCRSEFRKKINNALFSKSGDYEFCFTILWLNQLDGNKEARMENLSLSKPSGKIVGLNYGLFQKYQVLTLENI